MKIDLTHNIIIKETITEKFSSAVENTLIPKLFDVFGDKLLGIQMYEDYLADNLISDGYFYYPLTVVIPGGYTTMWIRWNVSNKALFASDIPYAFIGDKLDFELCHSLPDGFAQRIAGRSAYFDGECVVFNITTTADSATHLIGRFSQSFVDEAARQITEAISGACGVTGIKDSTIELDMVFAPESYMEHTSDNVTYRRLLMSAKGCAPRDFWIKWRSKGGGAAISCRDHVSFDDIEFSLGEDVAHKVREKEYRYLVKGNSNKYQTAMGKKNITEWRELIRRSIKRGELMRAASDSHVREHSEEVSDKFTEILERYNYTPVTTTAAAQTSSADDDIARMAREALAGRTVANDNESNITEADVETAASSELDDSAEFEFDTESVEEILLSDDTEDDEALALDVESVDETDDEYAFTSEGDDFAPYESESSGTLLKTKATYDATSDEMEESVATPGVFDIPTEYSEENVREDISGSSGGGAEIEILRQRLTDEVSARCAAEERLAQAKAEIARLESEKAAAVREHEIEADGLRQRISILEEENNTLKTRLDFVEKERAREKELYAEAARREREAVAAAERAREEERRRQAIEAGRIAEEAERAEAERIAAAEREAELVRIENDRRQREEKRRNERKIKENDAIERMRRMGLVRGDSSEEESEDKASEALETVDTAVDSDDAPREHIGPENHPYTSVKVKLIFRYAVDPNIKTKLYEVISLGLVCFKKDHMFIKLKAPIPEPNVVVLDFQQFPEGEDKLLGDLINLIGNSDLGVVKAIIE